MRKRIAAIVAPFDLDAEHVPARRDGVVVDRGLVVGRRSCRGRVHQAVVEPDGQLADLGVIAARLDAQHDAALPQRVADDGDPRPERGDVAHDLVEIGGISGRPAVGELFGPRIER